MTLAADISEVLAEVGTLYSTVKPDGSDVEGEYYFDSNSHTEHTTPMIRGYFFDFTLTADSPADIGDVIEYVGGGSILVMAKAPEIFENQIIDYLASGYVANAHGDFLVYSDGNRAERDGDYRLTREWKVAYEGVRGTIMDRLFRSAMKAMGDHAYEAELDRLHLWVSSYYDVKPGMRFQLTGGDYYKVAQIEQFRFPGLNLVFLTEDTRK